MASTGPTQTHFKDFSEERSIVVLEQFLYSCAKLSLMERDDPFWTVLAIQVWNFKLRTRNE